MAGIKKRDTAADRAPKPANGLSSRIRGLGGQRSVRQKMNFGQPDRSGKVATRRGDGIARPKGKRSAANAGDDRQGLLLESARREFAARGLAGARVDHIAVRSGVNKQLVYYYFGSKDGMYLAVLEDAYRRFAERFTRLDLHTGSAAERLTKFIELLFDSLCRDKEFLSLVADQNLYAGRHIKRSQAARRTLSPLITELAETLDLARNENTLKFDADAVDLYLTIAGICAFYFTNSNTLSAVLGRQFDAESAITKRRKHVVGFILSALFRADR